MASFKSFFKHSNWSVIPLVTMTFVAYQVGLSYAVSANSYMSVIVLAMVMSLIFAVIDQTSKSESLTSLLMKGVNIDIIINSLVTFLSILLGQLAVNILLAGQASTTNEAIASTLATKANDQNVNMLYSVIAYGLISPIIEELIFRYLIFDKLTDKIGLLRSNIAPLFLSATLFMLAHVTTSSNIDLVVYFAIGLAYGLAYMSTKSIYVPIIAHIVNNTIVTILLLNTL